MISYWLEINIFWNVLNVRLSFLLRFYQKAKTLKNQRLFRLVPNQTICNRSCYSHWVSLQSNKIIFFTHRLVDLYSTRTTCMQLLHYKTKDQKKFSTLFAIIFSTLIGSFAIKWTFAISAIYLISENKLKNYLNCLMKCSLKSLAFKFVLLIFSLC